MLGVRRLSEAAVRLSSGDVDTMQSFGGTRNTFGSEVYCDLPEFAIIWVAAKLQVHFCQPVSSAFGPILLLSPAEAIAEIL